MAERLTFHVGGTDLKMLNYGLDAIWRKKLKRDRYDVILRAVDRLADYEDLGTVEELAALKEQTRWIPVSERLPDKSGRCLTCDQEGNIHIFEHNPRSKHPFFIRPDDMRYYQPTHWMQLPEAPKEAQDER